MFRRSFARADDHFYLVAFGSCLWQYYISNHAKLPTEEAFALSEEGSMVLLVTDMTEFPPIDRLMRRKVQEARERAS